MYWHSKYISFVSATLILWVAAFSQTKLYAQVNSIHQLSPAFNGNVLRDDEQQINQTQLPWVLLSNQPNQVVPLTITNKISGFLNKENLTPISCSTNRVVIIYINNKYVACTSPTTKFPPGTYNTNIPDLEPSDK